MAADPTGLWQGGGMAPPPPGFDTSRVSPQDAIVTLRSFRRRFAEAFDQSDDDDGATQRPPGGGLSPVEHAAATASALGVIGSALHQVMSAENPHVELPSGAPAAGTGETAAVLARLGEMAQSVADAMADIHGDAWSRTGQTAAGEVSALDIARLAVRTGIEHLRAAEQAISAGPR